MVVASGMYSILLNTQKRSHSTVVASHGSIPVTAVASHESLPNSTVVASHEPIPVIAVANYGSIPVTTVAGDLGAPSLSTVAEYGLYIMPGYGPQIMPFARLFRAL